MAEALAAFRVKWSLETLAGSDAVRLTCDDAVGQQTLSFDLPARTIPGLVTVLKKLIDDHPDQFPAVLLERALSSMSRST